MLVPWPSDDIFILSKAVLESAMSLQETTSIAIEGIDDPVSTITMEEALACVEIAVQQIQNTITNSFTAYAMGVSSSEEDDD